MDKKKINDRENYFEDLAEWNEHQYNPGHWTGGKIPPQLKYSGRLVGITLFVLGTLSILSVIAELYFTKRFDLSTVLMGGVGLLMIIAGVQNFKKELNNKDK